MYGVAAVILVIVAGLAGGFFGNNMGIDKGMELADQATADEMNAIGAAAYSEGVASVIIPECTCPTAAYSDEAYEALQEEYEYILDKCEDIMDEDDAWKESKTFIKDNWYDELDVEDYYDEDDGYTFQLSFIDKDLDEDDGDWEVDASVRVDVYDDDEDFVNSKVFEVEFDLRESGAIKYDSWNWA